MFFLWGGGRDNYVLVFIFLERVARHALLQNNFTYPWTFKKHHWKGELYRFSGYWDPPLQIKKNFFGITLLIWCQVSITNYKYWWNLWLRCKGNGMNSEKEKKFSQDCLLLSLFFLYMTHEQRRNATYMDWGKGWWFLLLQIIRFPHQCKSGKWLVFFRL